MKFLIALALLAVVSALPPRPGFGHQHHEDYPLEGPSHHENKHHQFNLIKSIYNRLIDSLNHPSQNENEEEERAINDIVDTINMIGHIIHDNSNNGYDNIVYNSPSQPQYSQPNDQEGDVPNKPPTSENEDRPNWHKEEKVPSIDSEVEVISPVHEIPVSDENESSELFVVDNVLENDGSEHDVSFVNQKDDGVHPIIAYNSISAANEVPAL